MSTSRRTNWTRIALLLITVLSALCFLQVAEKSAQSRLIAKADYLQDYETYSAWRVQGSQWTIENNQILSYNISGQNTTSNNFILSSLTFQGTDTNNNELEFAIIERQYGYPSSSLLETGYYPVNTNMGLTGLFRPNERYAYTVYIRRKDGGILTPSDMERSLIILYINGQQTVRQTTAIPSNWLDTTTIAVPNIVDTSTTIIEIPTDYQNIDMQSVNNYMTLPAKVVSITTYAITILGRLLALKYITPMLCFGLLVALAGWLFH